MVGNRWIAATLTVAGFLATAADGQYWVPITVPNGDFSLNGTGGAAWGSTYGNMAIERGTVLANWNFAGMYNGTCSRTSPTAAQYPDNPDYVGANQVAHFEGRPPWTNEKQTLYLTSDPIPGVTIQAARYRLTARIGNPNYAGGNPYKFAMGFLRDTVASYASASDAWMGDASGPYWVAPWDVNTGVNAPASWGPPAANTWTGSGEALEYTWILDNTGTGTPQVYVPGGAPNEGYDPGPNGTIYTDRQYIGRPLRIAASATFRGVYAALDIDNITLEIESDSPPPPAWHPGDANKDGAVDLQDFGALKDHFGLTENCTWEVGDFNADGAVDLQDFGVLKDHFGHTNGSSPLAAVPEPGSLLVLTALLAGATRRRPRPHLPISNFRFPISH